MRLSTVCAERVVVLVFYPLAFTPTCTAELGGIRDELPAFVNDAAQVLAVSCDSTASLRVFAEREGFEFPLLSDFWPHGAVCRAYGVFLEQRGFATRATFVIDRERVVRWRVVTSPAQARDPAEVRSALADLVREPA